MIVITGIAENELFTCPGTAAVGDAVYISASRTVAFADVSDATKFAQGIVWLKVSGTTCKIRFSGGIIHTSGLTAGAVYYLTSTATTTNTLSTALSAQYIGIAISTTELLFQGLPGYSTIIQKEFTVMPFRLVNGAAASGDSVTSIIDMPAGGGNPFVQFNIRIPSHWVAADVTTINLNVLYFIDGAGAYSVTWDLEASQEGATKSSFDKNILDTDANFDFPTGTTDQIYELTVPITDSDAVPDSVLGGIIKSDAPNANGLRILMIWIEQV